tara:strand:+ start:9379 stop:9852 length:474 start_codon:yes stop_codon:yes gene_type:complete
MNNLKKIKILFSLCGFIFLFSCGYQPILTETYQKFGISSFEIEGDKKLGQSLINRFGKIENAKNQLVFKIKSSKKREISSKSSAGEVLEYTVTINIDVDVFPVLSSNKILSKKYSQSNTYKASSLYVDSLNREKKIIDTSIKDISNKISRQLNLIYK